MSGTNEGARVAVERQLRDAGVLGAGESLPVLEWAEMARDYPRVAAYIADGNVVALVVRDAGLMALPESVRRLTARGCAVYQ